jgi:hypothetical protein
MEAKMQRTSLTQTQIIIAVITGMIAWFGAAMLMRAIVPLDFFNGVGVVLVYAITIPVTIPFVFMLRRIAGLRADQIAIGYTLATTAALLLDGTAFAFFPSLYADDPADALKAAATILWGAGVGQVLAFWMNKEAVT